MKEIYCKRFPAKGFIAVLVLCWVFIREEYRNKLPWYMRNHESIHYRQEVELLFILFYLLYGIEYVMKLIAVVITGLAKRKTDIDFKRAYMSVSLEREAYEHHYDNGYLDNRRHYAWLRYVFKLKQEGYEKNK